MRHDELLKRAEALGYRDDRSLPSADASRTLAEIVISRDPRLWAAFPALLANAANEGGFNPEAVQAYLQGHERDNFRALMLLSAALYRHLGLKLGWVRKATAGFARGALEGYLEKFRKNVLVKIGEERLFPEEVTALFLASFKKTEERLRRAAEAREQLGLEFALSRIFPPTQKQLFLKKLAGPRLSKTESEYFSRVIRKKALALANPDLHRLAQKVAGAAQKRP